MTDRVAPPMHATPDGEAEISLVIRLPWEDVARLGQEAGRLASQMQRPVTLDEAVAHRLRSRPASAAHAKPTESTSASGSGSTSSVTAPVSTLPRLSGTA
ncbi:hypothetical protein ACK389_14510 [Streptomyces antibioticus]|uniref:Uncharacterized protein n=1 Tax=Streptomyces antibioticus TaxID=1890 RepID=A0AAE6YCK4_STRAT|nr:hypothetical protein [Streptomyces antibioticus]MCX5172114.1 hypothetical protein [Streptomyces antibioticus]OOQ46882.1 hypothetical protein AFM16_29205 [Streptomyces antibioticus]QIT47188.1 hypothetical protein HCX60_29740 [Streptomyces antibioticus]